MRSLHAPPPSTHVQEVIISYRGEGCGVAECPVRTVRYIHNKDGKLLGRLDEMEEEERRKS